MFFILCFILEFISSIPVFAVDALMAARAKSLAGIQVNSDRLSIIAENIANAESTALIPGGIPYTRKIVVFDEAYDPEVKIKTVRIKEILRGGEQYQKRYEPYHPAADKSGYVLYPNVNVVVENIDAKEAQVSFQANLSAYKTSKDMASAVLDILR